MLVWDSEGVDDALWARLGEHFSEEEIVELGSFVCLTYGQQRVIKTWNVDHGEFLADTDRRPRPQGRSRSKCLSRQYTPASAPRSRGA